MYYVSTRVFHLLNLYYLSNYYCWSKPKDKKKLIFPSFGPGGSW